VAVDKMGIRANQGLYGEFWYYELTRLGGTVNQGGGVAIWEGDLNPYSGDNVPPSTSINTSGGMWQNIIYLTPYDTSNTTYGFAVDYRGVNPIVYVIVDNGGTSEVVDQWEMYDAFTPVHPLLYGNPTGSGTFDERANFGTDAFVHDPCTALTAWGASPSGVLEQGWGDANTGAGTLCP
jgi:hypothetical protein